MVTQIVTCFCLFCNDRNTAGPINYLDRSSRLEETQSYVKTCWGEGGLTTLSMSHVFLCRRYACLWNASQLAPMESLICDLPAIMRHTRKDVFPLSSSFLFIFKTLTKAWGFFLPHFKHCPSPQTPSTMLSLLTSKAQLSLSSLNSLLGQSWRSFTDCLPYMSPKF